MTHQSLQRSIRLKHGMPLLAFLLCASIAQATPEQQEFFNAHVAPILIGRCLECHADARKGGLDLRSRALFLEGGKEGTVVSPGDPASSRLFEYVSTGKMPPKKPLSPEDVEVVRQWVMDGAWFPDKPLDSFAVSTEKRAGYDWWSLNPLRDATPPKSETLPTAWRENPIDTFIYEKLRDAGLEPSPPASSHVLIRRATYDLVGLPPTPEEIDAFVAACASETGRSDEVGEKAYRELLDRLLASASYGEQWGRHWLDAIRYGESNGYERNVLFDNIWPFRDYVIRSFNDDKPFSRLTLEHLAGDAVSPGDPDVEVGMTFLVCGPFDDVGNQDPVNAAQIRADNIDEMIRTTSEAFLGLTMGCARCHDHKFDPISQRDYYSLYATFAGVYPDNRQVATPQQRRARDEVLLPQEQRKLACEKARDGLQSNIIARAETRAAEFEAQWTRPPVDRNLTEERFAPVQARQIRLLVEGRDDDPYAKSGFRIDEFEVWSPDERNVAAATNGSHAKGSSSIPGDFANAYDASLTIDGKYGARWIASGPELTITFSQPEEIERVTFSSDRPAALVKTSGEITFPAEYQIAVSMDGATWTDVATSRDRKPVNIQLRNKRLIDEEATPEEWTEMKRLDGEITDAKAAIAAAPVLPVLRVGRLEQPVGPFAVFLGGDPQRRGVEVTPASPRAVAAAGEYALFEETPERERRLLLAQWLINKNNPLTPRVLANRLWQFHFGVGIVSTSGDFGFMGERPSHPELLDWLAREIIRPSYNPEGVVYADSDCIGLAWRLKRIHKLIMLSQAYRQSGGYRAEAASADADSRLLWRFPPRRLTAEEIRDTMLVVAGKLDAQMGGPGFRLYRYLNDNVSTYVPLDAYGPETYRRSVYHQQARAMQVDLITDFDAPDCALTAPRRIATTSPLQALTLLNHRFTLDMAGFLAERLEREVGADASMQVRRAYLLAFAREPKPDETEEAVPLVRSFGLRAFCRALFNANETIYLN